MSGQNRHHLKKKERRSNKRERENERERKRERKNEENESVLQPKTQPQQHHFLQRKKKHRKLCLSTHHGEPRSGGNLERVTREKRERGAFLIVCSCVFSLFFLSKRSARKVRERFYSFPK